MKRILSFSTSFPTNHDPIPGVFVKERVRNVDALPDFETKVIAPVPYFPPISKFERWYKFSQIPKKETIDGLEVFRPRYFLVPKIGHYIHAASIAYASFPLVKKLQKNFDFDLIDAHFIFPNGVAAEMIARRLNKPFVVTCRGEDIEKFPALPYIGDQIRQTLKRADALVALSERIEKAMLANGADPKKITRIGNGVDCKKFTPVPKKDARKTLNLPQDRPVVISVGYRLELKGFHLLVDTIPKLLKKFPNLLVVIIGGVASWGEDYTPVIEERIKANQVENHVMLAGPRPPKEMHLWYSATDLFALLSSREGSPNVVMEATACGAPVLATSVGGIPEIINDPRLGHLIPERTVQDAAEGIEKALSADWDRKYIRNVTETRSWEGTANKVGRIFNNLCSR
ncbi:MAG: glycosyltransferase [Desulfobacterales bacterium]|nr:glycosyltransferase [Desulfobacterales bacterium]